MPSTPITELDFSDIKTNLIAYLNSQTEFADYDFTGSNLNVLIDLLSYNTFYNNFYTNMATNEMFIDSAVKRNSILSHAKELNYLPSSFRSASLKATLTFDVGDETPDFINIPAFSTFTGTDQNGNSVTFTNDVPYIVSPIPQTSGADIYTLSDVELFEGRVLTEFFTVTADTNQKYVLSNPTVDTNSIIVYVRENNEVDSLKNLYSIKNNLFGVNSTDKVFYLQPANDGKYEITFGNDVFGKEPVTGNVIEVKHRLSSGPAGNGIRTITSSSNIDGYTATATVTSVSEGGAISENVESIRYFAPKSIQVQERAVTDVDYSILLKNNFSEIQAVSVFGGEESSPPQFGKVVIAVDVKNADGVSEKNKNKYKSFIKERCPVSIDPVIISPEFLYAEITTNVKYNLNVTSLSSEALKSAVLAKIQAYITANLGDFNKTLSFSKLSTAIDSTDTSIISNQLSLREFIKLIPTLNVASAHTIEFKNALKKNNIFTTGEDISSYDATVKTSTFTYNGKSSYIVDNGLSVLKLVSFTVGSGYSIVNSNIGSVDYATGKVLISSILISAFVGSAIKVYAKTAEADITGSKNKLFDVNDQDILITITGKR